MKKIIGLTAILTILLAYAVPTQATGFEEHEHDKDEGQIQGYTVRQNADGGLNGEPGSTVSITCNGVTKTTTTNSASYYHIKFGAKVCPYGSNVTGLATLGLKTANNSQIHQPWDYWDLNFTYPYIGPTPTNGPVPSTTPIISVSLTTIPPATISPSIIPPVEVPEFGMMGAVLAGFTSLGAIIGLRRKN